MTGADRRKDMVRRIRESAVRCRERHWQPAIR